VPSATVCQRTRGSRSGRPVDARVRAEDEQLAGEADEQPRRLAALEGLAHVGEAGGVPDQRDDAARDEQGEHRAQRDGLPPHARLAFRLLGRAHRVRRRAARPSAAPAATSST
jgi:hypothetical protein